MADINFKPKKPVPLPPGADVPLYDVVDYKEAVSLPECSNAGYSTVSMATLKREDVYTEAGTVDKIASPKERKSKLSVNKRPIICLVATLVGVLVLMVIFCGLFVALFLEVSTLKSQFVSSQESSSEVSKTATNDLQQIRSRLDAIEGSKIHQLNASITEQLMYQLGVAREINVTIQERFDEFESTEIRWLNVSIADINRVITGLSSLYPATSCAALLPSSPSGYYWVAASNGSAVRVYCDMTRSCGNVTGGWMRVAELDMTNSSHQCPNGLRQRTDSNKRTCVRNSYSAGCSSVTISTATVGYSRVCGRIIAYQIGSTNAFSSIRYSGQSVIDSYYVDGVSLTHGSPRHHIWTLASGLDELDPTETCPCISNDPVNEPPGFVGSDYFCNTGSAAVFTNGRFYGSNPLWDGAGCGPLNACCSFNNPPWFSKQLPQPTTDDIEMRVCRDQDAGNEDVAVESVEIYVH